MSGTSDLPILIYNGPTNEASSVVDTKFTEAMDMADEAWANAIALINELKTVQNISLEISNADYEIQPVSVQTTSANPPTAPDVDVVLPAEPETDDAVYVEDNSYADLDEGILDRLEHDVANGGTGLDPEVEQALWDRNQNRLSDDLRDEYEEKERYFAARGYSMPPGALNAALSRLDREHTRRKTELAKDIAVSQAELAQKNTQFALEHGTKVIQAKQEDQYRRSTFSLERLKTLVQIYVAKTEAVVKQAEVYATLFESEVKAFEAVVEGIKVDVQAQVEIVRSRIEQVKAQAEIAVANADIQLKSALAGKELKLEAMKSSASLTSQLCAAALSSVHASAQLGKSISETFGHSYALRRSQNYSVSENIGN